jgi:hypothetical protein
MSSLTRNVIILTAGITKGYGLDGRCSILGDKRIYLLHKVHTSSIAYSAPYNMHWARGGGSLPSC